MRRQSGPAIHGRAFESTRGSAAQALPLTLIRRCAPPYAPHPCGAPCGPPAAFAAAPAAAVCHGENGRAQGRRRALPSPNGRGAGGEGASPRVMLDSASFEPYTPPESEKSETGSVAHSCLVRATQARRRHATCVPIALHQHADVAQGGAPARGCAIAKVSMIAVARSPMRLPRAVRVARAAALGRSVRSAHAGCAAAAVREAGAAVVAMAPPASHAGRARRHSRPSPCGRA